MGVRKFQNVEPKIHSNSYIDDTALLIGDVEIGENSSVWPYSVIRGDVNRIRIGNNTNVQDHSVLHVTHDGPYSPGGHDLQIGNNITIGHRVILHGCKIMSNCLIGMGSTIMDGAIVHPLNLIGAGSLVSPGKELESGYLWVGSPARRLRPLTEEEIESIEYSAQHYIRVMHKHIQTPT